MNILIAEDELYLAQSISNALNEHLESPKIKTVTTINDAINFDINFNIVILSATLNGNIYEVINKYKKSTIILLVPYINHDTVTAPLNAGVDTYILKPFMIEELLRKINYHLEFKQLKKENETFKAYCEVLFEDVEKKKIDIDKIEFPLFIKSENRKQIDKIVFDIADELNMSISFYNLNDEINLNKLKQDKNLLYLLNFDNLNIKTVSSLFDVISNKKVVIELKADSSFEHPNTIEYKSKTENKEQGIMSIEDYIKYIIRKYEDRYPDTELSKKLGISRKSLWEKRKKYGIKKK